ncbi:hypothetical protein GCM10027425_12610 [Alteromonas gracilis]
MRPPGPSGKKARKLLKADGVNRVDARCSKCGRRWLQLRGTSEAGLDRRHGGVAFIEPAPEGWRDSLETVARKRTEQIERGRSPRGFRRFYDPWEGGYTNVPPQVSVVVVREDRGPSASANPLIKRSSGPWRYRINCHKRCGRTNVVVTHARLDSLFKTALSRRSVDLTL